VPPQDELTVNVPVAGAEEVFTVPVIPYVPPVGPQVGALMLALKNVIRQDEEQGAGAVYVCVSGGQPGVAEKLAETVQGAPLAVNPGKL
jgi:hypothetical protein